MSDLRPPDGYMNDDGREVGFDIRCATVGVAVASTSIGFAIILSARGENAEEVGVLLDLEDADAVAECARVIRSGRLHDA